MPEKTVCSMAQKTSGSISAKLIMEGFTLMRTISSGMFIMALVSQLSRLLAKLRMA